MSSHIICPQAIFSGKEYQLIDDFGSQHPGIEHLASIADFLDREFSLPLILDPEIVDGFASDSSNLSARADALCRPESERPAAIILRTGRAAGIPITFSAGRSNLTGSATAESGIVVSTSKLAAAPIAVDVDEQVVRRNGTYTIMTDAVVPPENFARFLSDVHGLLKSEGIDYLSFGHFGDCHLHFTLLPARDNLSRATELYDLIVARAAELGGVYSGEHGTGKRKRTDFLKLYGQSAIEQLKRCKAAVDPDFLVNRGNVFIP